MTSFSLSILQLFKEDPETGITHVALSSDSTYTNQLHTATVGYETLHLEKLPPSSSNTSIALAAVEPPSKPRVRCLFPDWLQGRWEAIAPVAG